VPTAIVVAYIALIASILTALGSIYASFRTARMQDRRVIVERRLERLQATYTPLLEAMQGTVVVVRTSQRMPNTLPIAADLAQYSDAMETARIGF
jgi:hypothetical protein